MIIKRICCMGGGNVGGPVSTVIALKCPGILVTVVDENCDKIMQWNSENLPIHEPGLDEIVKKCRNKNLFFSTDMITAIKDADMIFLCVDAPPKESGFGKGLITDLKCIDTAVRLIADVGIGEKIIVEKSTVPVKAAEIINKIMTANHHSNYQVLSNPEFLSEGTALNDLLNPDRILIGGEDTIEGKVAMNALCAIYEHWIPKDKIVTTNKFTSELIKLATNAFLAQRLSSVNSLSPICEATGSDINVVAETIGLDSRIGQKFLTPSLGFGGRGFKKDILTLAYMANALGFPSVAEYWEQVIKMNTFHLTRFSQRIVDCLFHSLADKKIGILGFAYKEGVKDSSESAAVYVCRDLLNEGAKLNIYDPLVPRERILKDLNCLNEDDKCTDSVTIFDDPYQCLSNTHAIVVCTAWSEFKTLDYEKIFSDMIKPAYIFDGHKYLPHHDLAKIGYNVESIGATLCKPVSGKNFKLFTK